MKCYQIIVTPRAEKDILSFYNCIFHKYKQPLTAQKNFIEINKIIQQLSYLADAIGYNPYVQAMFGDDARHIIYKKMAIIYVIRENVVYIKRFIAGSLIY